MAALVAAERGRNFFSGTMAALGLACSKLLAILAWPAIVFFQREGIVRRLAPMILLMILHITLLVLGLDVLAPVKDEFGKTSSGNIWFLISIAAPGFNLGPWGNLLSIALFAVGLGIILRLALQRVGAPRFGDFDVAVTIAAATFMLFLLCSRKTYTMYLPMAFPFIVHTMVSVANFPLPVFWPSPISGQSRSSNRS